MSRQLKFVLITLAVLLLFFYAVRDILLPFVLGITFAYLLDPLANQLQKKGIPRNWATVFLTICFFILCGIAAITLLPLLFDQLNKFSAQLPQFYRDFDRQIVPLISAKLNKLSPDIADKLHFQSKDIADKISTVVNNSLSGLFASGISILNFASLILITPVVTFYMLRDWDRFVKKIDHLLPRHYAPTIREQVKKIDDTIAAFIHGQLNACIIMGFVYAVTLTLIGLNFGLIIGFITGLLIFIPFVGFIIGAGTGILVAYFQYPSEPQQVIFVAGTFLIIHLVESNLITPRIVGGKIGIHPAWLIFGMLAGGSLLGMVGVILSVPMTAIIGVLVRFAIEQYSISGFYNSKKTATKAKAKK